MASPLFSVCPWSPCRLTLKCPVVTARALGWQHPLNHPASEVPLWCLSVLQQLWMPPGSAPGASTLQAVVVSLPVAMPDCLPVCGDLRPASLPL